MFESNQKKLFEELEREQRDNESTPTNKESRKYRYDIWGKNIQHNNNAEWLVQLEAELVDVNEQADVQVTVDLIEKQLRKMENWKSPGPDGLQAYWLKNHSNEEHRKAIERVFTG